MQYCLLTHRRHHNHIFVYYRSCHAHLSHAYYVNCTLLWQHTDVNLAVTFVENKLSVSYLNVRKDKRLTAFDIVWRMHLRAVGLRCMPIYACMSHRRPVAVKYSTSTQKYVADVL